METLQEAKVRLRRQMLARRRAQAPAEVERRSAAIQDQILNHADFSQAQTIAIYIGIGGEVGTDRVLHQILAAGKRVGAPVTMHDEGILRFAEIQDPQHDLQPARFGLREPRRKDQSSIEPAAFDWILVPGVAFDRSGYRLGYGKGYYDRFLAQVRPDCVKAGLAHAFQVVDRLPTEGHDVSLDLLFTEAAMLEFNHA